MNFEGLAYAIIPTILIPFTVVGVLLSSLATFIAALFGVTLKAEGPKRLLEVLLKPKVILTAIALNLIFIGTYKGYLYVKNMPRFEFTLKREHSKLVNASHRFYPDSLEQTQAPFTLDQAQESPVFDSLLLEQIWETSLESGSFRGATLSGESLFIGTWEGFVHELDLNTGEHLRSFYVGTSVTSAPVIHNGFLFAGEGSHYTHRARIYKFDLASGNYVGSFQTKGHTQGQPVVSQHQDRFLMFSAAGGDGLYAIDPHTLEKIWHQFEGHTDSAAKVSGGKVFVGTGRERDDGSVARSWALAYDFLSGEKLWKRELPASSWMQPVVVQSSACFVYGEIYFESEVGGWVCFHNETGEILSSYYHGAPIAAVPLAMGPDLVISDYYGKICRISRETGQGLWCFDTKSGPYSIANPVYDPQWEVLLYPSLAKGLFVLDPHTGKALARWAPKNPDEWGKPYGPITLTPSGWVVSDFSGRVRLLRPAPSQNP